MMTINSPISGPVSPPTASPLALAIMKELSTSPSYYQSLDTAIIDPYTFTRGADKDVTIEDFEGNQVVVTDDDEVRFLKMRRVENILADTVSSNNLHRGWLLNAVTMTARATSTEIIDYTGDGTATAPLDATYPKGGTYRVSVDLQDISLLPGDVVKIALKDNFGLTINMEQVVVPTATRQRFSALINTATAIGSTILSVNVIYDTLTPPVTTAMLISNIMVEDVTNQTNKNPCNHLPNQESTQLNGYFTEADATGSDPLPTENPEDNTTNSGWYWGQSKWRIEGNKLISQNIALGSLHSKQKTRQGARYAYRYTVSGQDLLSMSIAGNAIPGGGVAGATYTGTVVGDTSFSNQLVLATSGAVVGTEITEFSIVEYNTGCNVDAVDYFSTTNGNTVDGNFVVTESAGSALPDPKGWLIEGSSTNLFLNSDAPVTQPTMAIPIPSLYTLSITGDYVVTVNGSANQTSAADYTFFAATTANVVIVSGTTGTVQIEEGIAATSYIPTLGTARTRGVEELQLPASEYAEAGSAIVTIGTAASGTWFMFSDTAGTNEVGLSLVSSKARLTIITGGVTVAQLNTLASPVEGDKIGVVWVDGDLRIYHNGVLDDSGTGTPPASGDITQLNLGSDDVPSGHINGTLGDFTLFRKALSDEEMISYTS